MYGSGAVIGMEIIAVLLRLILLVQVVGRTACFGAAVGATTPGAVACLTVSATAPTIVAAATGCGWPCFSYNLNVQSFTISPNMHKAIVFLLNLGHRGAAPIKKEDYSLVRKYRRKQVENF